MNRSCKSLVINKFTLIELLIVVAIIAIRFIPVASAVAEWDFTDGSLHGFRVAGYKSANAVKGVGFKGECMKNAFLFSPAIQLDAAKFKILELEMETENSHVTIYFSRKGAPFGPARGVRKPFKPGSRSIRFDFSGNREWRDIITGFRVDAVSKEGQGVVIRAIRFLPANAPQTDSANLFRDGNFSRDRAGGINLIQPGGFILSRPVEIPETGLYEWKIKTSASASAEVFFSYRDVYGNDLARSENISALSGTIIIPETAAWVSVRMKNTGNRPLTVEHFSLSPVKAPAGEWSANWIWDPEADAGNQKQAVFRREFQISEPEDISGALLQMTGDDMVEAVLNGKRLCGPNASSWMEPDDFACIYTISGQRQWHCQRAYLTANLSGSQRLFQIRCQTDGGLYVHQNGVDIYDKFQM